MDILLLLTLIVLNGAFAMSEIAIVSARKARLQQRAAQGDRRAALVIELGENPGYFLSTVQIGITLIGILSGAFGEVAITQRLIPLFSAIPGLDAYAKPLATGTMVIMVTYVSLIIGELVPKRIGMHAPERIALLVVLPMRALSWATHPVVSLLTKSTEAVLRLFRLARSDEPPVTEEEVKGMLAQGAEAGVFDDRERELVENVFHLDDLRLTLIMTPLPEVDFVDATAALEEQQAVLSRCAHAQMPVCDGDWQHVAGMLYIQDILPIVLRRETPDLRALVRPILFAPAALSPLRLLDLFRERGEDVALVVDEYGEVEGLVTLRDIMTALVGEVETSGEADDSVVVRDDGSWLVDGLLSMDRFRSLFPEETVDLPDTVKGYQTVAGFVFHEFGHIPQVGEYFRFAGLQIEVVDMDGRRIDRLLITRLSTPAGDYTE